jgi:uncharacterized protein (TIGR03118 family)
MRLSDLRSTSLLAVLGAGLMSLPPAAAQATDAFQVTNLVSDGFVPAAHIDPALINPWGISYGPTGPFWVSDNNSGVSTLYNTSGTKLGLTVGIPAPGGAPGGTSTGQVFNGSGGFAVSGGGKTGSSLFLFATEDGTISGWSPSVDFTHAIIGVDRSAVGLNGGAVYKGLAIGAVGGSSLLYAANFRSGQVEMFDSHFNLLSTFGDPNVAAGYAPFNVQNLGGTLYVTYALQDPTKHDDVAGAGNGYVDAFNLDGTFNRRIVSLGGQIDSPWGLDIAPSGFRSFAGDLLVGNFGDGTISAFDPISGAFKGKLLGLDGNPLVEGDLWGLINGNGAAGGDPNKVYFTAGLQDEAHGLFGSIAAAPEPSAWAFMILGLGLSGVALRRRARSTGTTVA